jgi:FkbM family methyltransferase
MQLTMCRFTSKKPKRGEHHFERGVEYAKMCRKLGFWPKKVADVGVNMPSQCETVPFIAAGCQVDLFEPQPLPAAALRKKWGHLPTVQVHEVALVDELGPREVAMVTKESQPGDAYVEGISPPNGVSCHESIFVTGHRFDEFDTGDYDFVQIDTEGSDWLVIKHMVSRPRLLVCEWKHIVWVTPFAVEIMAWAKENGYTSKPLISDMVFTKS